jgi:hypothetical protein
VEQRGEKGDVEECIFFGYRLEAEEKREWEIERDRKIEEGYHKENNFSPLFYGFLLNIYKFG